MENEKNQEQKNVNAKGFEEVIKISPAGYHRDRALNTVYGISEKVSWRRRNVGLIEPTPLFLELAEMFKSNNPSPAGGWYLVREQREWLLEKLIFIFKKKHSEGKKKISILEAGVASFNHHFSYLLIIKQAIEEVTLKDLSINVTVTDKAFFPLFCIEKINPLTIDHLKTSKTLDVFGNKIQLYDEFIEFISKNDLLCHPQIKVRTKQYDLTDSINTNQLGKFDIITEHFITSVLDNFEIVKDIRASYSNLLFNEGYLLDATGITPHLHGNRFDEFLDINEGNNLFQQPGRINVWDPYGMKVEDILKLLQKKTVETPFDNGLFVFQKLSPQDIKNN